MDSVLNIRYFSILNSTLNDKNLRNSIRLLTVFGNNGSEVIFATHEDEVYGYGLNKSGCLGLGSFEQHVRRPQLNQTLTGKRLVNIVCGFDHCIGLTTDGQCYAWGQNEFGQLGIGSYDTSHTPSIIKRLAHKAVVQISCGRYHTLALTSDGQVFAWGRNMFGQLGDESYISRFIPKEIQFCEEIVSISCGRMHSMALSKSGRVYVWGLNESGQLGRNRECDIHAGSEKACTYRPSFIPGFTHKSFKKAICGPMHSLLLSTEGDLYSFGDNTCGQVGNGSKEPQFRAIRINPESTQFKDIISYFENHLSIGVSTDDKYFVWGSAKNRDVLAPKLIPETISESVFNVYAIYAKNAVTFKTFVIKEEVNPFQHFNDNRQPIDYSDVWKTESSPPPEVNDQNFPELPNISQMRDLSSRLFVQNNNQINGSVDERSEVEPQIVSLNALDFGLVRNTVNVSPQTTNNDLNRRQSSSDSSEENNSNIKHSIEEKVLKLIRNSFNNPNNYDLKIVASKEKVIYCHKTVVKIRNNLFWQILRQKMVQNSKEIYITPDSYPTFYAYIQLIYGLEPLVDDENVEALEDWSDIFREPLLREVCEEYNKRKKLRPTLSNVCSLYEHAINFGSNELEMSCIEFASNNWMSIIRSNEFHSMNETLGKQFLRSIIR